MSRELPADTTDPDDPDHDLRCHGDCYHCSGTAGIDVGIGFMPCIYCGGSGKCQGCSPAYLARLRAMGAS